MIACSLAFGLANSTFVTVVRKYVSSVGDCQLTGSPTGLMALICNRPREDNGIYAYHSKSNRYPPLCVRVTLETERCF